MKTEVRLLGPGSVTHSAGLVEPSAWPTTKTFDLLRVLALSVDRAVESDTLTEHLWPSAEPARASTSLRAATYQLRRVLGNESIVRVGHGLMLHDAWVDVEAFRSLTALIAQARREGQASRVVDVVRQAELLYRADVDVTETNCALLHESRHQLRMARHEMLLEGAEAAGSYGDWRQSLAFAQGAAAIDTTDRSTRALMRAWFAVGETGKPVEEFERLRCHLAEDYGVDPAPQTRALYLEVISACTEWPPRESVIGRDDEVRQAVTAAMTHLRDPSSHTGMVWLVGPPGSGRRTVARETARVLMVPLATDADASASSAVPPGTPGGDVHGTLELLPDQGVLTRELAVMLRLRAATWNRTMLVPVSGVTESALDGDDSVVEVRALGRSDFARLMAVVLQGRPTPRLQSELHAESGGLPGLACRIARHRLRSGDLTWTPHCVDSSRHRGWKSKAARTLAAIPVAFGGLVGGSALSAAEAELSLFSKEHEGTVHRGVAA